MVHGHGHDEWLIRYVQYKYNIFLSTDRYGASAGGVTGSTTDRQNGKNVPYSSARQKPLEWESVERRQTEEFASGFLTDGRIRFWVQRSYLSVNKFEGRGDKKWREDLSLSTYCSPLAAPAPPAFIVSSSLQFHAMSWLITRKSTPCLWTPLRQHRVPRSSFPRTRTPTTFLMILSVAFTGRTLLFRR